METPKYITLEVSKLEDIIINSINKVYGSHIGYITKNLKEALIENRYIELTDEQLKNFVIKIDNTEVTHNEAEEINI